MDIFDDAETPAVDPTKDYYAELVGENLKFKTNQDLARAKVEADAMIARVIEEKRQLLEDLKTRTNMQDFLDQMKNATKAPLTQTEVTIPPAGSADASDKPDFEALVQKALADRDAANTRERNAQAVKDKLIQTLGPNYTQHVKQRAGELGIPVEWLSDAAAKSPAAFFQLLGLNDAKAPVTGLPDTRVNTAAFGQTKNEKNFAYYNQMRKTNPTVYHSPAIQKEMWEQAKKLGADF